MPIGVPIGTSEGQATFLEICQRTVQECRLAHGATLLPVTVLNQVGEMRRMVEWVAEAWFEIQSLHPDWRFKRHTTTFPTIAGQAEYTTVECGVDAGTFGRWVMDSFRNYETAVGLSTEQHLSPMPYEVWRDTYQFGTIRTSQARPNVITWLPNNGLGLAFTPPAGYTILGDYFTAPIRMEADEDVPELPISHSYMIIVYKAMTYYGEAESAFEVLSRGEKGYSRLLTTLELDQAPQPYLAGALW